MRSLFSLKTAVLVLLVASLSLPAAAAVDEVARKGQTILETHKDAVITVSMVISISFGGDEMEDEMEANATVIDPSGLSVLALSAVDPTALFEAMGGPSGEAISRVKDMKMILGDGSEIDAGVVLRDRDLDMAFIRPIDPPDEPMPYVDIEQSASPEMLEELVLIGQLGMVARRSHMVFVERVQAIVERPRTFYILAQHRSRDIMCSPAFDLEGNFVGIGVMRAVRGAARRGLGESNIVVLVTAEDIREAAEQAPEETEPVEEEMVTPIEGDDDAMSEMEPELE